MMDKVLGHTILMVMMSGETSVIQLVFLSESQLDFSMVSASVILLVSRSCYRVRNKYNMHNYTQ